MSAQEQPTQEPILLNTARAHGPKCLSPPPQTVRTLASLSFHDRNAAPDLRGLASSAQTRTRPQLYCTDAGPHAPIHSDLRYCTRVPPVVHTHVPPTIDPEPSAGRRPLCQRRTPCAIVDRLGSGPPSSSSNLGAVRRGEDGCRVEEVPFCSSLRH
jgi:hypothetical protein